MTAICVAGGPSSPKPGVVDRLVYLAGASNLLPLSDPALLPLLALVPLLGNIALDTPTFCATDPPAMPTFTAVELLDLALASYSADFVSGLAKLGDLVRNVAWFQLCECNTGAQPTPPSPPSLTNLPTIVGPGYGTNTTPCAHEFKQHGSAVLAGPNFYTDFYGTTSGGAFPVTQYTLPGGATTVVFTFHNIAAGIHNLSLKFDWGFYINNLRPTGVMPTATVVGETIVASGATAVTTVYIPAGANGITVDVNGDDLSNTNDASIDMAIYCGGGPGAPVTPCCPPDGNTVALLNQINKTLTLIQRQHVPFATIHGATHAGLSGNGSFAVHGILALAVDVTTLPARAGTAAGDPESLWEIGWVRTATVDGWGPRHFISADPFVISPIAGDVELVGYSIPADVTVTITEVVREP